MSIHQLSVLLVFVGNLIRLYRLKHHLTKIRAANDKPPVTWKWLWNNRREQMFGSFGISMVSGFILYTINKEGHFPSDAMYYTLLVFAGIAGDKAVDWSTSFVAKKYGASDAPSILELDDDGKTLWSKSEC